MSSPRHLVGVDLGTVNTALAAVDLASGGDLVEAVLPFPIPQLVAPGEVAPRRLLPSFLYLPGPELAAAQRQLPWPAGDQDTPAAVVGELAREQGARVPGRLVASAKSWLANARADRTAPLLPWGAPEGVPRLSPVDAAARILAHLRAAWDAAHPDAPLGAQDLALAVPASFDAAARELTLAAARQAGLSRVALVEEPTAAFHDWASRHRADLSAALRGGASGAGEEGGRGLVLVVDVGGGTTDLTLVRAEVKDGRPALTRLAVGDHLLLGGDNMDLALARAAEARLPERLDPARFAALAQACRTAKERLLAEGAPERLPVAVVGRGSWLVASAVSVELSRDEVWRTVRDGFFPDVLPGDRPRRAPRTAGLAELGLPYESDPAVTRHVVAFLAAHAVEAGGVSGGGALARPDAILVNGGAFIPAAVRARLAEVISALFPGAPPIPLLGSPALDLAVARGAALSLLTRRGIGLRVGGGSPRAFYVGIATPDGERALCVVPRHQEEGVAVAVPRPFTLTLGRPVRFPLFASARARLERPGELVPVDEELAPLPPVEVVLQAPAGAPPGEVAEVAVRLEALLTEIGTLELWCAAEAASLPPGAGYGALAPSARDRALAPSARGARERDARWKLEFQLRGAAAAGAAPAAAVGPVPRRLEEARALVEMLYGRRAAVEKREVKGLFRALEKALGPREGWTTAVVRDLWAALHAGRARRRRSAEHERLWCQLTGYCLRPGFGAPLDAWRVTETWAVFAEGLQYQADPRAWQAWWVLWRRIAGGLPAAAQARLFEVVGPFVRPGDPRRSPRVAGVKPEAQDEMIRLAASLERVAPGEKAELGEGFLARLEAEPPAPHLLWAVGRLGARVPFHGSAHQVVPPATAEAWVARLLALRAPPGELVFPLTQLARRSGDRARDLSDAARGAVLEALARARAPGESLAAVREVVLVTEQEEQRMFGESLPAGLALLEEDPGPPVAPP